MCCELSAKPVDLIHTKGWFAEFQDDTILSATLEAIFEVIKMIVVVCSPNYEVVVDIEDPSQT